MYIDYLWHSEAIINIQNSKWETIRILSDAWLMDYSVADLMQRNPIVHIDYNKFENLDAIFISHSHIDHFDPYTLVEFSKKLKNKPIILLPETLAYTKPLLDKYVWFPVQILKDKKDFDFKWIKIQWIIFPDQYSTNEADVMTISVRNDKEIFYAEVDVLPHVDETWLGYIYELFNNKKYETKLYVSTRNELEWNLSIIDMNPKERKDFSEEYKQKRTEEIYQHYETVLALEEEWLNTNIYWLKGFIRSFIWQWIIFPAKEFGSEFLKLQIMKLPENIKIETQAAMENWLDYPMYVFEWGKRYHLQRWDITKVEEIPWIKVETFSEKENLKSPITRKLVDKPLHNRKITESEITNIQNYLNNKFLPYQIWNFEDSLKNAMLENWRSEYIINIKLNNKNEIISFRYWFDTTKFEKLPKASNIYDEIYWASDLADFLDWKQELYCNFLQYLEPWTNVRLWACMWANFINHDLVIKKLDWHFNLALQWKTAKEFVLKYYN